MKPRDVLYQVASLPMQAGSAGQIPGPPPPPPPPPPPIITMVPASPATGPTGVQSAPMTVGWANLASATIITPTVVPGPGTFSPAAIIAGPGTGSATLRLTPLAAAMHQVSLSNDGGITNPLAVSYTATQPPSPTITLTAAVPPSGLVGVDSPPMDVSWSNLAGAITITPGIAPGPGIFSPAVISAGPGAGSIALRIDALAAAVHSISLSNSGGITNPAPVAYSASNPSPPPPPPPPAPSLTWVAPSPATGTVGIASGDFTATLINGVGSVVVTPSSNLAGSWSPSSRTMSGAAQIGTFKLTPGAVGTHVCSLSNDGGISAPSALNFSADAAPATGFSLSVTPSSGTTGAAATVRVIPNGPLALATVVTLACSTAPLGTTTLNFSAGATAAQTTSLTPVVDGTHSVTMTNNRGLTNAGSPTSYTSVAASAPLPSIEPDFRTNQSRLFSDLAATTPAASDGGVGGGIVAARGSVASPKNDYAVALRSGGTAVGPTQSYVESACAWAWANSGGDWIDSAGTLQGTSHHISFTANSVTSGSATYTPDFTVAAKAAFHRGKWNAYIVTVTGGARAIAALHHPSLSAPSVSVTYVDGETATLACTACARLPSGTAISWIGAEEALISASVALEFEMPTKYVSSATLHINITQHSATAATIKASLAYPPVNTEPPVEGIAVDYQGDVGIGAHPNVLFSQQFTTTVLTDYVLPLAMDFFHVSEWNESVIGVSATDDDTKLPEAYRGTQLAGTNKWATVNSTPGAISIVAPDYTGDNFVPATAGQGAMRVLISASSVADGGSVGSSGTLGAQLLAPFHKDVAGLVDSFTVRFMVRFHWTPQLLADTKMYRHSAGEAAEYAVPLGKFGIGGHHWVASGGNSNVGGGDKGWSNRMGFVDQPADVGGAPRTIFSHVQDQIHGVNFPIGKDGGLGGTVWPDQWYCIEIETILNTYDEVTGVASSDGVQRIYVNRRLDSTHSGWKFREGVPLTPDPVLVQAFRRLGAWGLTLNDFHGGTFQAGQDLIAFYSNIVVTDGPLIGGVTPPLPAWRPAAGTGALIGYAKGTHPDSLPATREEISPKYMPWNPSPGTGGPWAGTLGHGMNSITAYCSPVFDQDRQELYDIGSGHAAYTVGATYRYKVSTLSYEWAHAPVPEDGLSAVAEASLQSTPANINATYPAGTIDTDEGEWIGESTTWASGLRQPGKRFPIPGHSVYGLVDIPPWASATKRGHLLLLTAPTGKCNTTTMASRWKFNKEAADWRRTSNVRSNSDAGCGGSVFFGGSVRKVLSITRASSGSQTTLDVYDPIKDLWTTTTSGGILLTDLGGGLVAHEDTGLLLVVMPARSDGTITWSNATKQRIFAVDAATAAAGSHTWTELTISASSWPIRQDGGGAAYAVSYAYCPKNAVSYAVNGANGSTTLWRLKKPASGPAISGTWALDTETITALPNYDQIGNPSSNTQVYRRLFWMHKDACLGYQDNWIESRIFAITPAGL